MFRHSLNIDLRRKDKARPAMFLLLALFLLSACPVKRAIHFLLFDKGIENADLTKKAPLSGDFLAAGSETCSLTDQSTARVDISSQASQSLFPIGLAFFFLLPAFSLKDLLTKGLSYYSQVTSVKGLAPIYLRNRRLLI